MNKEEFYKEEQPEQLNLTDQLETESKPIKDHTVSETKIEQHYAGFWMRFWAYIIDLIVIGSIDRILIKPIFNALDISPYALPNFSPITIATAITFYLYFVLMTKFFGQTLGKMVLGVRVISTKQSELTWGTVLFREFIGRFISKTTIIGYLLVGFLPKKQGLHDLFSDTTVLLERNR
jgi:uncharacterized RDD family membrane protein YckC